MPRLYAYPATLSRSVAARATEREPNALYGREVYTNATSHRIAPRHAASRRVASRFPFVAPRSAHAAPCSAAPRHASRGRARCRRGERCPSLSNYTCPLLAIASHLSFLSAPTFIPPFPFSFLSLFFFLPPVSFPSRLCSPRRVSSNAIMLGLVCLGSFVFSPALLGFCYWTDLSVSYNDYCYRSLGI